MDMVLLPGNVAKFQYFRTTVTVQNSIHQEIESSLSFGNPCYHAVQNLLSSLLLSKKVQIKKYTTAFLPVVLCWLILVYHVKRRTQIEGA
jgi:hypothetical protein